MQIWIRAFALALAVSAAAQAITRFTGEKGAPLHRTRLAAGYQHTCALRDDGTAWCWGSNSSGQLGEGDLVTRPFPVQVANLTSATSITAGDYHTCAIVLGGVRCWGYNLYGQLGNGTIANSSVPVKVSGLSNVVSMSAGGLRTCAVRVDGTVWCWGFQPISPVAGIQIPTPTQVPNISGAVSVATGALHSCAGLANGKVICWGNNVHGELGNNSTIFSASPVFTAPLSFTGAGAVDLSAGAVSTCARLSDGSVACWGGDSFGQVGNGTLTSSVPTPAAVKISHNVVSLTAASDHACAILVDGFALCWGEDSSGVLGDGGSTGAHSLPFGPVPSIANAIEIATGNAHSCATIVDGSIRCWGDNSSGQHGDGIIGGQPGIDSVSGINGTFLGRGLSAGNEFTCGRRGTGTAACWGAGTNGQLGNGVKVSSADPVAVNGISTAVGIYSGTFHACSVEANGFAQCWGQNLAGELGDGNVDPSSQPVFVLGDEFNKFVSIAAGRFHTCALLSNGNVQCWGAGGDGQLGYAAAISPTPVTILAIQNAVAIAAGDNFSCALIVDGTVRCWGDNRANQLGDGGTEQTSVNPKTVPGLQNIVSITAGSSHACARSAFGTVVCWGANGRGQIGNGSTIPAPFPSTVVGITDAISISGGGLYSCALHAQGTMSCWGANDSGELSAIDSLDHLTPTPAGRTSLCLFCGGTVLFPFTGIAAIATGTNADAPSHEQTCVLFAGGVIDCWGDNSQGEIGNGATGGTASITAVNSFAANLDPAATLRNGRIAEVTALIACDAGDQAHIILNLEQGGTIGSGQADASCTGQLLRVRITVPAEGPSAFAAGPATGHVEAIVRNGADIVEDTHWTRQVVLSISN